MANKIPSNSQWQDLIDKIKSKQDVLEAGDITTNLIADNSVTASKIDFSTYPDQVITVLNFGKQTTQTGTMTKTTLKGTQLTIQWVNYGQRFCITNGGENINHIRQAYSVKPEGNTTTGSYLIGGLASGSKTYTYGNGILNGTNHPNYQRTGISVVDSTFDSYSTFIDVGGAKAFTIATVDFVRGSGNVWNGLGSAVSSGLACYISFGVECTTRTGMLPHFCQGATGSPRGVDFTYEIFE